MFSFHKTSLFFIIFLLCPILRLPFKEHKLLYIVLFVCILLYQKIATALLPYIGGSNSLSIAIQRASTDTTFELESMGFFKIMLVLIYVCVAFVFAYVIKFYSPWWQ